MTSREVKLWLLAYLWTGAWCRPRRRGSRSTAGPGHSPGRPSKQGRQGGTRPTSPAGDSAHSWPRLRREILHQNSPQSSSLIHSGAFVPGLVEMLSFLISPIYAVSIIFFKNCVQKVFFYNKFLVEFMIFDILNDILKLNDEYQLICQNHELYQKFVFKVWQKFA